MICLSKRVHVPSGIGEASATNIETIETVRQYNT